MQKLPERLLHGIIWVIMTRKRDLVYTYTPPIVLSISGWLTPAPFPVQLSSFVLYDWGQGAG